MDTNTHRGPMDYPKWIANAARQIQNYYTAHQGEATTDGDICEIIECCKDGADQDRHSSGCICADCSGAELTADND